jgi:hypothetical protein
VELSNGSRRDSGDTLREIAISQKIATNTLVREIEVSHQNFFEGATTWRFVGSKNNRDQ